MAIIGAQDASGASFFDGIYDVFCTCLNFYQKKQHQKLSKNHEKINFLLVVSVFGLPPLAPNRPLPRAIFDGICDVLCTSRAPQKRAGFLPRGGGSAAAARPPIAKAKATPHAMRSNMPGIRCLVHRRIEGLPPMPPTPVHLCFWYLCFSYVVRAMGNT